MVLKENQQPIEVEFQLAESGLNVFTEVEIDLPVNLQSGLVFDIDKIEYNMSPSFDPVAAGEVNQEAQFTLTTQANLLGWRNVAVIAGVIKRAHASAALLHSAISLEELHMDTRGRANLIARTSIFLGIDSLNTTVVWTITGRLIGSLVKLKADQLTQLVLQQL